MKNKHVRKGKKKYFNPFAFPKFSLINPTHYTPMETTLTTNLWALPITKQIAKKYLGNYYCMS
jgi:hypothetical protein